MLGIAAAIGVGFVLWFMLVVLFTPRIDYHVSTPLAPAGARTSTTAPSSTTTRSTWRCAAIVDRLQQDFETDLQASDEVTSTTWQARRRLEKLIEPVCRILERQQ